MCDGGTGGAQTVESIQQFPIENRDRSPCPHLAFGHLEEACTGCRAPSQEIPSGMTRTGRSQVPEMGPWCVPEAQEVLGP